MIQTTVFWLYILTIYSWRKQITIYVNFATACLQSEALCMRIEEHVEHVKVEFLCGPF